MENVNKQFRSKNDCTLSLGIGSTKYWMVDNILSEKIKRFIGKKYKPIRLDFSFVSFLYPLDDECLNGQPHFKIIQKDWIQSHTRTQKSIHDSFLCFWLSWREKLDKKSLAIWVYTIQKKNKKQWKCTTGLQAIQLMWLFVTEKYFSCFDKMDIWY